MRNFSLSASILRSADDANVAGIDALNTALGSTSPLPKPASPDAAIIAAAPVNVVKPGTKARKLRTVAPPASVTAKPVAIVKPAKPATDKPVASKRATSAAPVDTAKPINADRIAHHASVVIARNATACGTVTMRDLDYLSFFGYFAKRNNGVCVLRTVADSGRRVPGSHPSKPVCDGGAINRLRSHGFFTISADGLSLIATAKAKAHRHYAQA